MKIPSVSPKEQTELNALLWLVACGFFMQTLDATIVNTALPAMSFVAIPGLIGPLIGPTLGGLLVEVASWHWIFLINVPVGVIGAIATLVYMPDSTLERVARFDRAGYALLAFGMVFVSLALDGLSGLGLHHAGVLIMLIFGLASITAYWLHAARHSAPLFSPQLFSIPTLSIGLLGNLFSRLGSSFMPLLVPLLLQVSMGYSPLRAGMMMLPVALAGIAVKKLVTTLITRAGYRRVLVVNTVLLGLLMAGFGRHLLAVDAAGERGSRRQPGRAR
jgi:MFS family permease